MPSHHPHRTTIPTYPNNIPIHPLQRALSEAISEYNLVAADWSVSPYLLQYLRKSLRPWREFSRFRV